MGSGLDLLKNALIMDSETLSLSRGTPLHEFAVLDLESQVLHEYILKPQRVVVAADMAQELTRLASSRYDKHQVQKFSSWQEAIKASRGVEDLGFLDKALAAQAYPHLSGTAEDPRRAGALMRHGARARLGQQLSVDELILKKLPALAAGKTLWFANARFDSKVVGAHLGAAVQGGAQNPYVGLLETYNPDNLDPFYVTGKEVNQARIQAQLTGDWSGVWTAYKKYQPKAGETAVRDIQDVMKAVVSMSRKAGMGRGTGHFGMNMDMAFRLIASTGLPNEEALEVMKFTEAHRAAEDVAINQRKILEKVIPWADALESLGAGRATPEQLSGPLKEVSAYMARMEAAQGHIVREALASRFGRAELDILEQGFTAQTHGYESIRQMDSVTPSGTTTRIPRLQSRRVDLASMDEVVKMMETDPLYSDYGVTVRDEYQKYLDFVSSHSDRKVGASAWMAKHKGSASEWVGENASRLLALSGQSKLRAGALRANGGWVPKAIKGLPAAGKGFLWAAGAATAVGGLGQLLGARREAESGPNLVATTYDQWVMARTAMQEHGYQPTHPQNPVHQGFPTQGFAAEGRRARTDFGSPYRGPVMTEQVFIAQDLQRERENWLRKQYGARHFDPEYGLFGRRGAFKDLLPQGYRFLPDGTPVPTGYQGVRGRNLLGLDLNSGKWKVEAEDADTVVVKRGGVRGAIASMFGMNREYSFRLAGIDSPETSHGAQSYHAPQPGAEASTAALQALIAGSKNLELVYDPTNTTYGRMMGVLVKDGKNLNFEMVRRGIAAHLPYGKSSDAMVDYRAMKGMEERAYTANRGIWAEPWAKAFYDISESSGNRLTFNTLARKESIAQNVGNMSMLSLMEQAQAQGFYGQADALAASAIGKQYRIGKDKVQPFRLPQKVSSYASWNFEMASDTKGFVQTHGTGRNPHRYSRTSGYGKMDGVLGLDMMGASNHITSRKHSTMQNIYRSRQMRANMQARQRDANQIMNRSPVGHYQMM